MDSKPSIDYSSEYYRIIGAGYRIINEGGFERVSVDTIAVEAGVSREDVLKNFGSKENLLQEILEYATNNVLSSTQKKARGGTSGIRRKESEGSDSRDFGDLPKSNSSSFTFEA